MDVDYIGAMDQNEFREKLEAEIEKTQGLIRDYKEQSKPVALDNAIGRLSRMDAINNKSITEAALRKAEGKLIKLREALGKVGSADFGICVKCKQPIPVGRIILMPESNRCVNCAR